MPLYWAEWFWLLFRAIPGSQLLQSRWIIKQTVVLLWKICRKYGSASSVSYSFSCTYLNRIQVNFYQANVLFCYLLKKSTENFSPGYNRPIKNVELSHQKSKYELAQCTLIPKFPQSMLFLWIHMYLIMAP